MDIMSSADYITIVENLNSELYDKHKEEEMSFSYCTNGFADIIMFVDIILWCSETDDREWRKDGDGYEPLEPFIRKTFNEWVGRLYKLKF